MSYNLLFVCTGNTCRSPMAEALAREELVERGWGGVEVASAGVSAADGAPASSEVPEVLAEVGIELGEHSARTLTPELVEWADAVFVMGPMQLAVVESLGGEHKVAPVTEYVEGGDGGSSILDPVGQGLEVYRDTRDALSRAIAAVLDEIEPLVAP